MSEPHSYAERHPSTRQIMKYFSFSHLPAHLADISRVIAEVAHKMVMALPDGPELTAGLRKLLEAKDCFVRHAADNPARSG
jgi:hypothetical protein